jgi:predicted phage-related endonuclease
MLNELQAQAHYSGIGGTTMSSILGVNKYQSNVDAYLLLTDADYRKQQSEDISAKLAVELGRVIEPVIARRASEAMGWDLEIVNNTYYDSEHDFLLGHPDAIIKDKNEVVEIKTRGNYAVQGYGEEGTDQILDTDYIQLQHYMMLGGFKKGHLVCLVMGTSQIKYYEVERNDEVIAEMRNQAIKFWNEHVVPRVAPAPITYQEAVKLYPRSAEGSILMADETIKKVVAEAVEVNGRIKADVKYLDGLKAKIAALMQDNAILFDNESNKTLLTFNSGERKSVDTDAIKKAGLYDQFCKVSPTRTMLFK